MLISSSGSCPEPQASRPPALPLLIREATPGELSLIKSSWFKSFRQSSRVRPDLYSFWQNKVIDDLTARHPPIVATLESVPDEVLGWVCRTSDLAHYVYVKHDYRRRGVATALVAGVKEYTHRTKVGDALFRNALFNPYRLWSPE